MLYSCASSLVCLQYLILGVYIAKENSVLLHRCGSLSCPNYLLLRLYLEMRIRLFMTMLKSALYHIADSLGLPIYFVVRNRSSSLFKALSRYMAERDC